MLYRIVRIWRSTFVATVASLILLCVSPLSFAAQAAANDAAQRAAIPASSPPSSDELSYQSAAGDAFNATWERTDKLVASSQVNRTWMWGPQPNTGELTEPYQESPGGQRTVEYFDKSRMEITHPDGDPNSIWYVTNGLLAEELITGRMQTGDSTYEQRSPAEVNIAGDANDPNGPTYATFNPLMGYGAIPSGWKITQTVDRSGTVSADASLDSYGVTAVDVGAPTNHNVASVFWDFMNSSGPVYQSGQTITDKLSPNPFYPTGYPLTEAYWTHVLVGGVSKLVLVQVFERRVLTYTPSNSDGWKVEAGNVGQHYYAWRYGGGAGQFVSAATGGILTLAPGVTLDVPPGALSSDGTILVQSASEAPLPAAPPAYLESLNQPLKISVIGATIIKPVTLQIAFDPGVLPAGETADFVTMAYFDDQLNTWLPVGGDVDLANGVITFKTLHFSWWGGYLVVLEKALDIIKSITDLNLVDWVERALATSSCTGEAQVGANPSYDILVDESAADQILEGCIGTPTGDSQSPGSSGASSVAVYIRNLRSFDLGIACSPQPAAAGCTQDVVTTGEDLPFNYDASRAASLSVKAVLTVDSIITMVVRGTLGLVPYGDTISPAAIMYVEQDLKPRYSSDAQTILNLVQHKDTQNAASAYAKLVMDANFGKAVETSLTAYYLTPAGLIDGGNHLAQKAVETGLHALILAIPVVGAIVDGAVVLAHRIAVIVADAVEALDRVVTLFIDQDAHVTFSATQIHTQPPVPTAPSNVQASPADQHSINLTWNDNSNNEDGFKVYGSGGTYIGQVGANTNAYTVGGLDPNTNHCYVVSAFNSSGESAKSDQACATTGQFAPSAPSNAQIVPVDAGSGWMLTWQDNSNNEDGFQIAGDYYNQTPVNIQQTGANVASYVLPTDQAVYDCFDVSAFNSGGYSGWSNWACKPSVPAPPSNVQTVALSPTEVRVTWQDNSNNEDGFVVRKDYNVTVGANTTSYVWENVSPNTWWCFEVAAYNAAGQSDWSDWSCLWTPPEGGPPAVPSNVQATWQINENVDIANSLILTWSDNSNDETGFEIFGGYYNSNVADSLGTVPSNSTGADVSYQYWELGYQCFIMKSYNDYGYSDWSNWACAP